MALQWVQCCSNFNAVMFSKDVVFTGITYFLHVDRQIMACTWLQTCFGVMAPVIKLSTVLCLSYDNWLKNNT